MKLAQKKKGNLNLGDLPASALAIVVLGLVIAVGAILLVQFNETISNANSSYIIGRVLVGIEDYADWIPMIVVAIVASVVLFIIIRSFGVQSRGGY